MSRNKLLNDAQIESIGNSFGEVGATALAKNYGVSRQTIYRAVDSFAKKGPETKGVKKPTYKEFGVTGLQRFGGTIREDYNRTWQNLQTMVPLVKEMLDHPIVGATMFAVEMYIRTAEWTVIPGGDSAGDESARLFLEENMNDMSHTFAEHITQALSMLSYGFAPFEICYKKREGPDGKHASNFEDGRIGWRKFAFRSQDTLAPGHEWEFDENGGIKGMYQKHEWTKPEVFIPIEKMILYRTTAAKNNPQGRSALRAAYMAWYYAKNFAEIEGISAERMGGGLPVIYLGEGTSKAGSRSDFEFAKSVVRDVRSDEQAGVVFPYQKQGQDGRGVLFELVSPPAKGVVDFNRAIMRYNQQISQTLLAQFIFLGLTEYGTQSLAIELTDLFAEAMNGWLSVVTDVLNRFIVPRLFAFNTFTVENLPKFHAAPTQDVEVEKALNAITLAVGTGVLLPDEGVERAVRKMLNFSQRSDPESGKILSELPEYKKVQEDKIKNAQRAMEGSGAGGGLKDEQKLASGKARKHKVVRTPGQKVQQRAGSSKMSFEEAKDGLIDEFTQAMETVLQTYEGVDPMEVHVHNTIEAKAPDVHVDVDARAPEPGDTTIFVASPDVAVSPPDIHVASPEISVLVPEREAPHVDVHVDGPQIKNIMSDTPVQVDVTLQAPDEVVETETFVERDPTDDKITRTKKWSWRRGKEKK